MNYENKELDYDLMVHYIQNTSIETLAILYDVKADIDPMSLFKMFNHVTLSKFSSNEEDDMWKISFKIPSANRYKEEFSGYLNHIIIRIKVYLLWANSEDGKLAIKKYLNNE